MEDYDSNKSEIRTFLEGWISHKSYVEDILGLDYFFSDGEPAIPSEIDIFGVFALGEALAHVVVGCIRLSASPIFAVHEGLKAALRKALDIPAVH